MLVKFAVTNYRGFANRIEWDLSKPSNYSFNTFAIKDGIPYAIDFINLVPDSHPSSIRAHYFIWVVETMAKVAIEYLPS